MIGDPFADAGTGWSVSPASPAAAAFTDLMTAAMEAVMVVQFQRRMQSYLETVQRRNA